MNPRNRIFLDEKILIFNDGEWMAEIINIKSKAIELIVEKKVKYISEQRPIKLYFSPLKRSPNEILVQKCTEIGINIFQPVAMEHTNISKVNVDRLKLISTEAIEQSAQLIIPKINQTISFKNFIEQISSNEIVIACTIQCKSMSISQIVKDNLSKDISILIGPEGDFSKTELENIKTNINIVEASLGENILKGETATIVAAALIMDNLFL